MQKYIEGKIFSHLIKKWKQENEWGARVLQLSDKMKISSESSIRLWINLTISKFVQGDR
jgi:hypothetical protein